MLKVLLVDDEPFIAKGLSVIIDWNAEGFEIVSLASNGNLYTPLTSFPDLSFTFVR